MDTDTDTDILPENFRILGILCYLNYPKYLRDIEIKCVEDIFEKIEEKIEDFVIQIDELERYYNQIKNKDDKIIILKKINDNKKQIIDIKNQLNFIKNNN
jgi:hypothetical protein